MLLPQASTSRLTLAILSTCTFKHEPGLMDDVYSQVEMSDSILINLKFQGIFTHRYICAAYHSLNVKLNHPEC